MLLAIVEFILACGLLLIIGSLLYSGYKFGKRTKGEKDGN